MPSHQPRAVCAARSGSVCVAHSGLVRRVARASRVPLAFGVMVGSVVGAAACEDGGGRYEQGGVEVVMVREQYNNSLVVSAGGARVLIDTGLERDATLLDERLRSEGFDPADLDAVVVTHAHADHMGGARWFAAEYGVPVMVGRGDEALLASGGDDDICPTDDFARDRAAQDGSERYAPFPADVLIDDEDTLAGLTGLEGTLVRLPGHTDGTIAVVVGPFAFVGDLFRGDFVTGQAQVHFYMCDLEDNRRDIQQLLDEHPEVETFFPGHFGPVARAEVQNLVDRMARGDAP
jgi:glyoxylase-like metal-dependent hydrolase (beta-lactamase superfamily II)